MEVFLLDEWFASSSGQVGNQSVSATIHPFTDEGVEAWGVLSLSTARVVARGGMDCGPTCLILDSGMSVVVSQDWQQWQNGGTARASQGVMGSFWFWFD